MACPSFPVDRRGLPSSGVAPATPPSVAGSLPTAATTPRPLPEASISSSSRARIPAVLPEPRPAKLLQQPRSSLPLRVELFSFRRSSPTFVSRLERSSAASRGPPSCPARAVLLPPALSGPLLHLRPSRLGLELNRFPRFHPARSGVRRFLRRSILPRPGFFPRPSSSRPSAFRIGSALVNLLITLAPAMLQASPRCFHRAGTPVEQRRRHNVNYESPPPPCNLRGAKPQVSTLARIVTETFFFFFSVHPSGVTFSPLFRMSVHSGPCRTPPSEGHLRACKDHG